MKRRYQIDRERAVRHFEEKAGQGERSIQLQLPLKEIAAALQDGVGALMQLIMEDEVRKHAGEQALVQRCQLHKRRNVVGHLTEEYREAVDRKMAAAYQMSATADAKRSLARRGARRDADGAPAAARRLAEKDAGHDESDRVGLLRR